MWWNTLSVYVTKFSLIFLKAVLCLALIFLANQMLSNLSKSSLFKENVSGVTLDKVKKTNNHKSLPLTKPSPENKLENSLNNEDQNKPCSHVNNYPNWLEKYHRRLSEEEIVSTTKDCISWTDIKIDVHPSDHKYDDLQVYKLSLAKGETPQQRKKSFSKIYKKNLWGTKSKSGPGSLLKNAENVISVLTVLVERIKLALNKETIKILDSSCGDMKWMPTFLKNRPDIEFTGYDIVKDNINNHRQAFKNTAWKFEVHDLVTDPIPTPFDLILSRQTTQHLKTKDVRQILHNFGASNSSFLLTTNYPKIKNNLELKEKEQYRHRMINLHLDPFNFPPPVCQSLDFGVDWITLWDFNTLKI